MGRLKTRLLSSAVTALVFSSILCLVAVINSPYPNSTHTKFSSMILKSPFASQIYGATFTDESQAFDDIYIIKTRDKERVIIIYCNSTYCYKNRNSSMTA